MYKVITHSHTLSASEIEKLEREFGAAELVNNRYFICESDDNPVPELLDQLRHDLRVDINVISQSGLNHDIRLVISDMDSTLINIECVDEIADFASMKAEVSAITEAAMRGELDFNQSLEKRVKVLKGLDESVLKKVYEERLRLNPGAEELISGLAERGIEFALVSGGFTFFTERLKKRLGFRFSRANILAKDGHKLAGAIEGEIVNGSVKRDYLQSICEEMSIDTQQAIAVGDGANDLLMMEIAGLGVAYRAKPAVRAQADCQLNYQDLDALLDLIDEINRPAN